MNLTVEAILKCDFMEGARLLAGISALEKEIKYVDIIEVPDVINWINEGGFYLTTGYSFKDDLQSQKELVQTLAAKESAALCIKKGRYFSEIPEIIIKTANELNYPIIELPQDKSYVDILLPLSSMLLDKKTYLLKHSEKIHQDLTDVVLSGGGLDHLAQTLYKLIDKSVLIQDREQKKLVFVGDKENLLENEIYIPETELKKMLLKENINLIKLEGQFRLITPVKVSGNILGYVSIFSGQNRNIEKIDYRALQHAATVIALEMLKEKEKNEVEKRLKIDLFNDLIQKNYNSEEIIINRALNLNWDLEKNYLVIVFEIDDFESYYRDLEERQEYQIKDIQDKIKRIIRRRLLYEHKDLIVINKSSSFIVFYNCAKLDQENRKAKSLAFAENIAAEIEKEIASIKLFVGFGGHYQGLDGIRKSYQQARQAIEMGKKINKESNLFHYDDLGIFKVLVKLDNRECLSEFNKEMLGPLLKDENSDLLKTIEALLSSFNNKREAARKLNIHRNTLDYRIKKIAKLLDVDLQNSENWLNLYLAFKVKQML
ncbi:PucR family transcriptional regulator [Halanaerobium hydrogeniformans]|uniref:Transcriptional regulator, CdaR n=1 Tax=Halanaerobium hydrogeniformans TaxID=656519 RepID=E4RP90_HALHG|nr:PucR family transcriptional regulator [Halanaerobium hydrogeniformans]ADQ13775.1 transcriptional regulator, CdaR [Halanaerobium hydrogeniformans]